MNHEEDPRASSRDLAMAGGSIEGDALRAREASLARRVRLRDAGEYGGAVFLLLVAIPAAVLMPNALVRWDAALLAPSTCAWLMYLRARGRPPAAPVAHAPTAEPRANHRAALLRERDFLRLAPWVGAPAMLAACAFAAGAVQELLGLDLPRESAVAIVAFAGAFVLVGWCAVGCMVVLHGRRVARAIAALEP